MMSMNTQLENKSFTTLLNVCARERERENFEVSYNSCYDLMIYDFHSPSRSGKISILIFDYLRNPSLPNCLLFFGVFSQFHLLLSETLQCFFFFYAKQISLQCFLFSSFTLHSLYTSIFYLMYAVCFFYFSIVCFAHFIPTFSLLIMPQIDGNSV